MIEKQIDLRFLDAKNDLVAFINEMPRKYNISFIFIDSILADIKNQVERSAMNDANTLRSMYESQLKDKSNSDLIRQFNNAGLSFSDDVQIDIVKEESKEDSDE